MIFKSKTAMKFWCILDESTWNYFSVYSKYLSLRYFNRRKGLVETAYLMEEISVEM